LPPQLLDVRRTEEIDRKHGTKVVQVVIAAPSVAAQQLWQSARVLPAAQKAHELQTMISGPGVVSANPSPSSICGAVNQP